MTSITKLPFLGKAEDGKEDKRDRNEDLPLGGQGGLAGSNCQDKLIK